MLFLQACGDVRPVAEPNEQYVEPSVTVTDHRRVENISPRELLLLSAELIKMSRAGEIDLAETPHLYEAMAKRIHSLSGYQP